MIRKVFTIEEQAELEFAAQLWVCDELQKAYDCAMMLREAYGYTGEIVDTRSVNLLDEAMFWPGVTQNVDALRAELKRVYYLPAPVETCDFLTTKADEVFEFALTLLNMVELEAKFYAKNDSLF